jgi:hypothetical protein
MKVVFSLFGRPRELRYCLESLARCNAAQEFAVHIDINSADLPVNREVNTIVDEFARSSGLMVTVQRRSDGFGPDINIMRTLKQFRERVIYCAGDVLFHRECLERYRRLNERFPDNPLTLYHSFAHAIHYEKEFAFMRTYAFESLLFNPANYFDYCLFTDFVVSRLSTTDWILSWLFHKRHERIYTEHFSYLQHLGVTGGNTSGRFPPRYALDYVDQREFFRILAELGIDLNLCKLVRA